MRPRTLALLAAVGLLLAGLGPALASPQPTPICAACGVGFTQAAEAAAPEVNASVAESTAVVQVHENGSATWTVRNELSQGADAFRERPESLEWVGERLVDRGYGLPDEATLLDVRIDGETAVLVFRDADAVDRRAGLLVVDYLHERGYERLYHVNTDSFTVRGPEGSLVTNTPESGRVDDRAVTWTGTTGEYLYEGTDLEGSPYVVFGPDRSTETTLRTDAALAMATWPIVERALGRFVVLQTLLFTAALGVLAYGIRGTGRRPDRGRLGTGLAAAGLVALVGPLLTHGTTRFLMGPALFALVLGGVVASGRLDDRLRSVRGQAALAAGLLGTVYLGFLAVYTVGGSFTPPAIAALGDVALSLPFALALPLGAAIDDVDRGRPLVLATVAGLSFAGVSLSLVNPVDPPVGLGGGLTFLFLTVAAILGPVLVGPFLLLGRSLRTGPNERRGRPHSDGVPGDD